MTTANPLPNLLTTTRLVAGLLMFVFLGSAVGIIPFISPMLTPEQQNVAAVLAFWTFVIGASTDFFDGWLARKLKAETDWGATLDPIADKVLICGAILGLISLGPQPHIAAPGAIILFREFFVASLRESAAAHGSRLPVSTLAKWKTTIQIVALGLELAVYCWPAFGFDPNPDVMGPLTTVAHSAMWLAAVVTLWTGWEYFRAARKVLPHDVR